MTDYKPGDRVRVSFEGAVDSAEGYHIGLFRDPEDGGDYEYLSTKGMTVEKITPDYKAQIEALEPGTAFVLTHAGKEFTYFRTDGDRIINRAEEALDINRAVWLHVVTDLRILK